jgi:hypothetical protein
MASTTKAPAPSRQRSSQKGDQRGPGDGGAQATPRASGLDAGDEKAPGGQNGHSMSQATERVRSRRRGGVGPPLGEPAHDVREHWRRCPAGRAAARAPWAGTVPRRRLGEEPGDGGDGHEDQRRAQASGFRMGEKRCGEMIFPKHNGTLGRALMDFALSLKRHRYRLVPAFSALRAPVGSWAWLLATSTCMTARRSSWPITLRPRPRPQVRRRLDLGRRSRRCAPAAPRERCRHRRAASRRGRSGSCPSGVGGEGPTWGWPGRTSSSP